MKTIAFVTTAVASVITAAVALHFYWQDRSDRLAAELAAERQRIQTMCNDDIEMWGRTSVQAQASCGRVKEFDLQQRGIDTSKMTIEEINRKY